MTEIDKDWQMRAQIALFAALKSGQAVTYDALAQAAGIPAPHRIHKLTLWLEQLMAEDAATGQPLRAAIIVSRLHDWPARGFFDTARQLGLLAHKLSREDEIAWYYQERKSAFKAYGEISE